jgi:hypothetical protein
MQLAERLQVSLQIDARKPTGKELVAQLRATKDAIEKWVTDTYPVGAEVRYLYSGGSQRTGTISGNGTTSQGTPFVSVSARGITSHLIPTEDEIEVIAPPTQQNGPSSVG